MYIKKNLKFCKKLKNMFNLDIADIQKVLKTFLLALFKNNHYYLSWLGYKGEKYTIGNNSKNILESSSD